MRVLIAWPPETSPIPFSSMLAYHYTYFGETIGYMANFKHDIKALDGGTMSTRWNDFLREFAHGYDLVAILNNVHYVRSVNRLATLCHEISPETKIITFGVLSSYIPNYFAKKPYDAVVYSGDWEFGIKQYVDLLENRLNLTQVSGLIVVRDKEIIKTATGKYIDSTEWSWPAVYQLPVDEYIRLSGRRELTVTASRGCPFGCPFCNAHITFGKVDRRRDAYRLAMYLGEQRKFFDSFRLFSPTFTLNKVWLAHLYNVIRETRLKIRWKCTTRVDQLNEDVIKMLADSGCREVGLGIETLGEETLRSISKPQALEDVKKMVKLLLNYGVEPKALLMVGLPYQTKEEIYQTIRLLTSWGVSNIRFTAYAPYQNLKDNMSEEEIEKFDRRTHFFYPVAGMSRGELLRLIFNTSEEVQRICAN